MTGSIYAELKLILCVFDFYVDSGELLDTSLSGYLGENSDIIIPFSSPATAYERCKLGNFPIMIMIILDIRP